MPLSALQAPVLVSPAPSPPNAKLLLIDFRSGEAVCQHPELIPLLKEGWQVKSAVPRIVESEGTKLFVVLTHAGETLDSTLCD